MKVRIKTEIPPHIKFIVKCLEFVEADWVEDYVTKLIIDNLEIHIEQE